MHSKQQRVAPVVSLITGLIVAIFSPMTPAREADEFGWSITPYLWATNTSVDIDFRDNSLGGASVSFDDLLDVLDTSFQINVEAGRGNWTGFVDLTYVETSDTDQRNFQTGNSLQIDTDSSQTVIDAAAVYWPAGVGTPLSLFGGLRYTDFDDRYRFVLDGSELTRRRSSEDYYDALLGARYRFDLSQRWSLLTRADVNFGDSEGGWLLNGLFAYTVGKRELNRILFGYQYKQGEFEDGNLSKDFVWHGPIAGFNFRF